MGAPWLEQSTHSKNFALCLPDGGVGFLQVLQFPPTVQKRAHQVDWRLQTAPKCVHMCVCMRECVVKILRTKLDAPALVLLFVSSTAPPLVVPSPTDPAVVQLTTLSGGVARGLLHSNAGGSSSGAVKLNLPLTLVGLIRI